MYAGQYFKAAIASAAAFPASSASTATSTEPVPVYQCMFSATVPEEHGHLLIGKSFREDGTVNSMYVHWEDNAAGGLTTATGAGDRVFVSLRWPGEHRIRGSEPFQWSEGSITMTLLLADAAANFNLQAGEEWRQVIVDRNETVNIYDDAGVKALFLPGSDMHLASDLEAPTAPGRLNMSLDSFLAWGSGARRITVYETRVTRRKPTKNSYPTSPAGRYRIVGAYDVNISALTHTVASIREASERWETSLSSSWRQCNRSTEGGDIVVTDAGRRR